MRHSIFLMPIALCLLLTSAPAQTAKSHYEAGERAAKEARWVDAGREFEQAAKMAPNNKRYQARFAEVRIEASQWAESAARILISADRTREARSYTNDALRFDPNNAGAAKLLEQLDLTNQRLAKLYVVQTVFVETIEGDNGEMTREQIKALLANTGRFQILAEDKDHRADATIAGRTEWRQIETQTTTSAQATGSKVGGGIGGGAESGRGVLLGGFGKSSEKRSENSVTSHKTVKSESLVLSLTLKSGEVIWGWDDTKPCNAAAKAKCAISDLVAAARR